MSVPLKLQPLFLLSDEPIDVSGDDGLSMNQTARVIAEAALGAATPFTVGIFGAWGHGKTSLLNAARTLLEPVKADGTITRPHPHVVTVQFNAWRYEKEEHPIVPLVASIARAIERRLEGKASEPSIFDAADKAYLETAAKAARGVWRYMRAIPRGVKLKPKLNVGIPGLVKGGLDAEVDLGKIGEHTDKLNNAPAAGAAGIADDWTAESLYLSAFDDLARLHAAAKASGANETGQAPVIVVFIDDLDRCRPEAAVEILEGIKLVLAQPGFVFVLALYREVIERYLDRQSEVRYGEKHKAIGEGYIDKIVQLPLWLPSHEAAFEKYIRRLINKKLKPGLLPHKADRTDDAIKGTRALLHAVYQCTPLLARLSTHSPRKLVRKINELLIDDRLLPDNAHATINCKSEERRAILFPLCLIQRALLELPLPQQIKPLLENDTLCDMLAKYRPDLADKADADGNVAPMLFREALKAKSQESGPRDGKPEAAGGVKPVRTVGDEALNAVDAPTASRWLRATECLSLNEYRAELLNTTAGRAWLSHHAARRLVAKAIATQAPVPILAAAKPARATEAAKGADDKTTITGAAPATISEELRQEMAIIDRAIRKALNLDDDAPVTPEVRSRVQELTLTSEPITDAGAAALAAKDSGLTSLISLDLRNTKVTDAGAAALAAKDSGLMSLTNLDLGDTQVGDAGAAALASKDSGLKALTKLYLVDTQVGDAGSAALASKDSCLNALTTLFLGNTKVTDAGAAALASKDSGLKSLVRLVLWATKVTDAGAAALAAKDSGLTSLRMLDLRGTQVSEAGAAKIRKAHRNLDVIH